MIDRDACQVDPRVVGLVCVEGKAFGRTIRCPGHREAWPYMDRKSGLWSEMRLQLAKNGRSLSTKNTDMHPLNEMLAQSGDNRMQPRDEWLNG